ncbi:hypothetical protein ACLOJK_018710 [Asimina triloba]
MKESVKIHFEGITIQVHSLHYSAGARSTSMVLHRLPQSNPSAISSSFVRSHDRRRAQHHPSRSRHSERSPSTHHMQIQQQLRPRIKQRLDPMPAPIGSTMPSLPATVSSLPQLAPSDPSLSDPCHPTLSSKRTISSFHFPHSTPHRHEASVRPMKPVHQRAGVRPQQQALHPSASRQRLHQHLLHAIDGGSMPTPPSAHEPAAVIQMGPTARRLPSPPHHQQGMIFTIDPNGVDSSLDQHRRGSDQFLLKLHRVVHSAEVTCNARSKVSIPHNRQPQATSSNPDPASIQQHPARQITTRHQSASTKSLLSLIVEYLF